LAPSERLEETGAGGYDEGESCAHLDPFHDGSGDHVGEPLQKARDAEEEDDAGRGETGRDGLFDGELPRDGDGGDGLWDGSVFSLLYLFLDVELEEGGGFSKNKQTFIGWTGRGIPKNTPVRIFHKPERTRVVDKEIELLTARVIMRGSRVPRSPNEPEISDRGDFRSVATLFACKRRILDMSMIAGAA
jgi:hypothetical protein